MNQVTTNSPTNLALTATLDRAGAAAKIPEGVPLRMASGMTGAFTNALGAGPHAFGKLHSCWQVRCGPMRDCFPPRDCHPCHQHHHHGLFGHHHHGHHHHGLFDHHHHHGHHSPFGHHHHHGHHGHHHSPFGQGGCFPKPFPFPSGGCFPQLPKPGCWEIPEPKTSWTAQMTGENTAKVDLGDGYKLEINEKNSEMTIFNEKTGERTRIWGDPHVEIDGKQAYDFWGTTTFTLENGTKLTINTEQFQGNPNMYVASQVLITKGDNAIVVDGISQNKLGDLSVTLSNDGKAIDTANRDGFTLHENKTGSGWRTEDGTIATQKDLDATRIGGEYGPGSTKPSQAEGGDDFGDFDFSDLAGQISNFLIFGSIVGSLIQAFGGGNSNVSDGSARKPADEFRPNRPFNPVLL